MKFSSNELWTIMSSLDDSDTYHNEKSFLAHDHGTYVYHLGEHEKILTLKEKITEELKQRRQ